jgi:hypothetical protein
MLEMAPEGDKLAFTLLNHLLHIEHMNQSRDLDILNQVSERKWINIKRPYIDHP